MIKEIWVPHLDLPIEVSDLGRIRCTSNQHILVPHWCNLKHKNSRQYLIITIAGSTRSLHRLVLEAFVGPRPEGMQARHLDGDRTNNTPSNLKWGTKSENESDKQPYNRSRVDARRTSRKEGYKRADKARRLHKRGFSLSDIAKMLDMELTCVSKTVSNRSWFDPNYTYVRDIQAEKKKITKKHMAKKHKFSPYEIKRMRKLYKSGIKYNSVWKEYEHKANKYEIWKILHNEIYRWVK